MSIGVDFGGARADPQKNWETPLHLSVFTTFPPKNKYIRFPNIFNKPVPVVMSQWIVSTASVIHPTYLTFIWLVSFYLFIWLVSSTSSYDWFLSTSSSDWFFLPLHLTGFFLPLREPFPSSFRTCVDNGVIVQVQCTCFSNHLNPVLKSNLYRTALVDLSLTVSIFFLMWFSTH